MPDQKIASDVSEVVRLLVARHMYPKEWARRFGRWESFLKKPRWKDAVPLMGEDPGLVSSALERLLAEPVHGMHDPEALFCLGKVRQMLDNHSGAAEIFFRLDRIRPNVAFVLYELGMSYAADGKNELARAALMKADACRPRCELVRPALDALSGHSGTPDVGMVPASPHP